MRKNTKIKNKRLIKIIKKVMSADVETKFAFHEQPMASYNSGITQSGDLTFPLPNVAQNVTESGRIGDHIKAKSLVVKGFMTMNLANSLAADCRIGVRVMVVQPKLYTNRDVITSEWSAWTTNLLRKGGTNTAFTGIPSDLFADINTDLITTYYNKVFYMNLDFVNTAVGAQGVNYSTKFFKINLKLRNKLLRYNSGYYGNLAPSNYCPVLLLGYCHLDGSTVDVSDTQIKMEYISNLAYEDA